MVFEYEHAKVAKVHDGDTIYCDVDLGFDITVHPRCRIDGINAPELSTDAGKLAKAFAETILPVGTPVVIVSHGWDKYGGRIDAEIWYGDGFTEDFGAAMLASGNAVPYKA